MSELLHIKRNDSRVRYLQQKDPELGKLINVIGEMSFVLDQNFYEALVKKINNQQLSIKAAASIWNRFVGLCPTIKPEKVKTIPDEALRSVGVSSRKITYIRDLTEKVLNGELNLQALASLPDNEIVKSLTRVKGIGQWSAEMFLIFSLGRENIYSFADVGLRRGVKWLYKIDDSQIETFPMIKNWAPYKTIASLYLWEIVNRDFIYDYSSIDELVGTENIFRTC